MPRQNTKFTYEAAMRVVHHEIWTVEADSEEEARSMIERLHASVETDETGGEIVDWDITSIKTS